MDDTWPPTPPPDPLDDVEEENPPPRPPKRRRSRSPTFPEVVASTQPPHTGTHRQRPAKPRRVAQSHARDSAHRKAKRAKHKQELGHIPATSTINEHVRLAEPLEAQLDASSLPSALGGYTAKTKDPDKKHGRKVRRSVAYFLGLGFQLIEWDRFTPRPIFDKMGRIVAVLAGQPPNHAYQATVERAYQAIHDAGSAAQFPATMRRHCRGLFAAITVGLSYGKGQTSPCWLNAKEYTTVAEDFLANEDVGRMAGFADAAFALWTPRLYQRYRDCDTKLHTLHEKLRRPFNHSVFFAAAFNFGPNVWTFKHRDILNLAFGLCAVQALGHFNPKTGGHLVLWDLKMVVEFSPGALILLPSATIAHSNIPVQQGEERASFTQFSAGGIFRYVDNGGQTVKELAEDDPDEYERLMALGAAQWEEGLSLLSTMDELFTTSTQ
ncbi:hypothetical protein DFH08DRAFT_703350 [Mycena albidolilacea]|uniref:Uncharacterized protein n=1 Tax=Mycena albidolilacea TaxID=1033008 RepID=A0AAD7ENH2_9AGAR|nr:hypothetical protein DFH08DRAFT_703350 [Mycena albidolilacea]